MPFEPPRRLVQGLDEARREGGGDGAGWLVGLAAQFHEAVRRRGLVVERVVVPGGRGSLVVLVRREDGSPAALKLAPAGARPDAERAALRHWAGLGAVRLLDAPSADTDTGADTEAEGSADAETDGIDEGLLLERLSPQVSLRSLAEAQSLLEAAGVLRRLWVPPPAGHGFETVADRTGRQAAALRGAVLDADVAPLVDAALSAREDLLAKPPEELLLHGAFRQGKVLAGERMPWLAVGPEPVVGESAFDLARLVRERGEDLIASPSGAASARRRLTRLAGSLDVDADRVRGWTLFRTVHSALRALRSHRPQESELLLEFASWL